MCIIILDTRKTAKALPKDLFKRCVEKYPDGLGLMYPDKGFLKTWKSMKDLDEMHDIYLEARSRNVNVACHFRATTAGADVSEENLHPFDVVPGDLAFMHNGTMNSLTDPKPSFIPAGMSDTRYFATEIVPHLPADFLTRRGYRIMLTELAGFSRLLFMDHEGRYVILNEYSNGGFWKEGIYFSNNTHRAFILDEAPITTTPYDEWESMGGTWKKPATGSSKTTTTPLNPDTPSGTTLSKIKSSRTSTGTMLPNPVLLFDYGIFGRKIMEELGGVRHSAGYLKDHVLYAVRHGACQVKMPIVHLPKDSEDLLKQHHVPHIDHKVNGTVWAFNNVSKTIFDRFATVAGEKYFRKPAGYSIQGEEDRSDRLAWVYYGIRHKLTVTTREVVPFGDWLSYTYKMTADEVVKQHGAKAAVASPKSEKEKLLTSPWKPMLPVAPPVVNPLRTIAPPKKPRYYSEAKCTQQMPGTQYPCPDCKTMSDIHKCIDRNDVMRVIIVCKACKVESLLTDKEITNASANAHA